MNSSSNSKDGSFNLVPATQNPGFDENDFDVNSYLLPSHEILTNYTLVEDLTLGMNDTSQSNGVRKSLKRLSSKNSKRVSVSLCLSSSTSIAAPSLSRSSKSFMVDGSEKPIFKCDVCGFLSNDKGGYKRHKCQPSAQEATVI